MNKLRILIIGGTGFIGKTLSRTLLAAGLSISILSRNPTPGPFLQDNISVFQADVLKPGEWQDRISGHEVVINLTGASIFRRWNKRGKKEILDSRILTTRNIVEAIRKQRGQVKHFISVSGVGYYGFHQEDLLMENNPAGQDFIAQVAAKWEAAAQPAGDSGARLVICRLGHVLGMYGGALPKLATLVRFHLGSHWGSGEQWISWVHELDLARAILFLINTPAVSGPVNITSPNPVRNREILKILTKTTGRGNWAPPVPGLALQIMLGQFSSVFVNGQRVLPRVLEDNGFVFKFPDLEQALRDLLGSRHQNRKI